eukprot:COSAG02_NODE_2315_length_9154_cov_229.391055_4_plen_720_part_00
MVEGPVQPLALRGPTRTVELPLWVGPDGSTDCTILGRKPEAGIGTTHLGLTNDLRISKEHVMLTCETRTGRWRVENLKANPIFVQRGFATNAAVEAERLYAGGQAAELAVGDAICFAVVDAAHRILVVPRLPQHQLQRSAPKRAADSGAGVAPPTKRARSPVPSPAHSSATGEHQPPSPAGDMTPIMAAASAEGGAARAAGSTAIVGLSPVPQAAFAKCVITFVERGMREKQLQVFKKQVQHGGGRWSANTLAVDGDGNVCTTHIVAHSWHRAAEAVGEALVGPDGLPVANADWMVQAIKNSKSGRETCKVAGQYRLLPSVETQISPSETAASCPVEGDIDAGKEVDRPRPRVPYSAGNFQSTDYRASSLIAARHVDDSQDSQKHSQSIDDEAKDCRTGAAAADMNQTTEADKVPLLITLFQELQDLTEADESKNNHWRVRNYQKMVNCLKKYNEHGWPPLVRSGDFMRAIEDIKEDRMPGCPLFVVKDCTETLKKAEEVLRTGTMARIEAFRQDPRMNALKSLAQVWGVGLKQASDLYAAGFTTLQSLRTPEGQRRLNRVQKLGLKYHEDLALRIPRDEITAMVALIKKTAVELVGPDKAHGLRVEGVGSYRRNKSSSGDIDVLLSHTDGITHVKLLELVVESLTASGFLREKLTDTTASSKKSAEDEPSKNKHTHTRQPNGGKYMGIALFDPATHGGPEVTFPSKLRPRHRHIDIFT